LVKRLTQYTTPGAEHRLLERFVGEWEARTSVVMGEQRVASRGTASFAWKEEGRWLESSWSGELAGQQVRAHGWLGYDLFKMSYVWTGITSYDTAMNHAEGDLSRDGRSLVLYGTLDEYLTGEHDKMVKYAYRFVSDDEIVLEVHDLPIGETGAQVMELRFTRKES